MEDDRKNRSGVFNTGQKGTVPPLVTTDFIVEDQGKYHVLCDAVNIWSFIENYCVFSQYTVKKHL